MLLRARLTTEVSIWANRTPSDVAISTRRGRARGAGSCRLVVVIVMARPSSSFSVKGRSRGARGGEPPEFCRDADGNQPCVVVKRLTGKVKKGFLLKLAF